MHAFPTGLMLLGAALLASRAKACGVAAKTKARSIPHFERPEVAEAFAALPRAARAKLLELRALIFETAASTPGVGPLEEALRWGEPSYLTTSSKSGTMIRIHYKARRPDRCALYVHCQTDLLERYRQLDHEGLEFEGSRGVLFDIDRPLPKAALRTCVRLALTYRLT